MATTIVTKSGSGAPTASDLVAGELAVDLTNKRLYTEDSGGTVLELGTNPSGNVTFGDNGKAIFGADSDLQIYHDGSNSYVKDAGTGDLILNVNNFRLKNAADSEIYLYAQDGGGVNLYHTGNAIKLATTATGIDVTGTVTADGLTVDGAATIEAATSHLRLQGTANTNKNLSLLYNESGDYGQINCDESGVNQKDLWVTGLNLKFGRSTGSESMRIDASGNVGLKNSSPSSFSGDGADLVIGTTSGDNGLSIISGTSGTGNIYFGDVQETGTGSRKGQIVYDHATDHMRFATAATERMRIDSSGGVIVNNGGAGNGILKINGATGNTEAVIFQRGGTEASRIGHANSADLAFYTGSGATERMRIDASGNLLIGTSLSSAKLTVGTFGDTDRAAQFHGGSILLDGGAASEIVMGDGNVAYMSIQTTDNATAMKIRNYSGSADLVTIERASGNVGIGTSSPSQMLTLSNGTFQINGSSSFSSNVEIGRVGGDNNMGFATGGTERMRIDASGNALVGRTARLTGQSESISSDTVMSVHGALTSHQTDAGILQYTGGVFSLRSYGSSSNGTIAFNTGGGGGGADAEAMRIDANGDVGIGLNNGNHRLQVLNDKANFVATKVTSTSAATSEYGVSLTLTNDPNDATRYFLYCAGGVADRAVIYSNGNIANTNNSYTGFSDLKLKENIVDAGSQWDDIKALRVRKYSFKEENAAEPTQIGVIAQEVEEAGMTGLVYESPDQVTAEDGTIEDTGEVTKTMKYSVLYMKSVKALQEAMERIESLEARIAALES